MAMACPHCGAELADGAKICRGCGRILAAGRGAPVSVAAPAGAQVSAPVAAPRRAMAGSGSPRCEICEKSPEMIQQVERNSPMVPGIMAFVALLIVILAVGFGWMLRLVMCAVAGGLGFVAYRMLTAERRYWLCPKCGDTVDIS